MNWVVRVCVCVGGGGGGFTLGLRWDEWDEKAEAEDKEYIIESPMQSECITPTGVNWSSLRVI